MIEQIIKLREEGLSFRKIAVELNTTVGRVQYRFNKWIQNQHGDETSEFHKKESETSEDEPSFFTPAMGVLQIQLVSPLKIAAFWDVSLLPKRLIKLYFNQNFEDLVNVIRIYDVKDIIFNGNNAHYFHEIAIPYQNGQLFIKGLKTNRSYIAELGVYLSEKFYFPLLRSSPIQTPILGSSFENERFEDSDGNQLLERTPPKWRDLVSTYSFYEDSKILEDQDDRNIITTR
jgi:uncharacterized protein